MTTARMPGRNPAPRVDTRNCYMTDEEAARRDEALALCEEVEEQHSLPAVIWYMLLAIASVGAFLGGMLLGSRS